MESWIDVFADLQFHIETVREAGDRVLTVLRMVGQGTGSGAPLDERVSFVWTLSAGRVTKVEDLGRDQASTK